MSTRSATRSRSAASRGRGAGGDRGGFARWYRVAPGERLLAGAVLVEIAGLMVAGGGLTGYGATLLISVLTMALLAIGVRAGIADTYADAGIGARVAMAGIVLLPLAQLVPLPPGVWHALPGQDLRLAAFRLIGIADSWQPLSLAPLNTIYTALIAIAFVTLTLSLMTLSREGLTVALRFVFAMIVVGLFLGVGQVGSGGAALRVHDKADHGALLGFLSNKNHSALVLAASLPIAALLTGVYDRQRRAVPWAFIAYWVVVVIGIVMTNSRAGVMLGLLATLAVAARSLRELPRRYLAGGVVAVVGLAAFLLSLPQVDAVFRRFNSVGDDLRWRFAEQSVPMLREFWLTGAGSGSYSRLYAVNEKLDWVKPTFVNHLHDDYYQIAIEQGLAGIVLLLVTVAALLGAGVSAWRHRPESRHYVFSAATIALLFALHSIVDYPLRRPATFPIVALAFAMIWWRARDRGKDVRPPA